MQNWYAALFFLLFVLWIGGLGFWNKRKSEQRLDELRAVKKNKEYPNNHHVPDVGYYHATAGLWHERPWNEYREGQGYYWDGSWHAEPDQRQVLFSVPKQGEVERVNEMWFAANPERVRRYQEEVERSGFGSSNGRTSGS
jgi:hypothetical protein